MYAVARPYVRTTKGAFDGRRPGNPEQGAVEPSRTVLRRGGHLSHKLQNPSGSDSPFCYLMTFVGYVGRLDLPQFRRKVRTSECGLIRRFIREGLVWHA